MSHKPGSLVRGNIFRSRGENTPRRRDGVDRAVGRNVGVREGEL